MKLSNCVEGQRVEKKNGKGGEYFSFDSIGSGKRGVIECVDNNPNTNLTVLVRFDNGHVNWGRHDFLKKV